MSPSRDRTPSHRQSPIEDLQPGIRGLIIDMDGVLWNDAEPIGDLPAVFSAIEGNGLSLAAATNNATRSSEDYANRLHDFGVNITPGQIITSADATAHTLAARLPSAARVFVVGEQGLAGRLQDAGFEVITDPGDPRAVAAVVASLDRALTYDKLRAAATHVREGALFFGTNPDPTFPTPGGLVPGSGSIVTAIATAAETKPIMIGKPSPLIFELAAERLGMKKAELLVVGDRLETDIAGGQAWGARTALVLSGVSSAAEAARWRPSPDLVAADLSELVGV